MSEIARAVRENAPLALLLLSAVAITIIIACAAPKTPPEPDLAAWHFRTMEWETIATGCRAMRLPTGVLFNVEGHPVFVPYR